MTFLDAVSKSDLAQFLSECASVSEIDVDLALQIAISHIQSHDKRQFNAKHLKRITELHKRWKASLKRKQPDFSVYDDTYYVCELWLCWIRYSRRYLRDISKNTSLISRSIVSDIEVKSVLDLGCGFGYTTAVLKEIFSDATVTGTNLAHTVQARLAQRLGKKAGFKVVASHARQRADLVFASEYFEHFERPVEHLLDVIQKVKPTYWLIANSFGTDAIGHFQTYYHENETYDSNSISRLFAKTMRLHGYEKVKTKCWNNRPAYWKLGQPLQVRQASQRR